MTEITPIATILQLGSGEMCRAFPATQLVQDYDASKMLGQWFQLFESNGSDTSKLKRCPNLVIQPWDIQPLKDRPMVQRFDISNLDGFQVRSGFFLKNVNIPIRQTLNGWQDRDTVLSSLWRAPFISPLKKASHVNSMTLDADYDHWAIIYICSDQRLDNPFMRKGASVEILGR